MIKYILTRKKFCDKFHTMKVINGRKFYTPEDIAFLFSIRLNDACDLIKSGDLISSLVGGRTPMVSEYAIKKFLNIHAIHPISSDKFYAVDERLEILRSRINEIGDYIVGDGRFNLPKR